MIISICKHISRSAAVAGIWALIATGLIGPGNAKAESSVAVSFFYEDLSPHGYWVRDRYYGTVWYPDNRSPDWQPYLYGRWVWTAEYGWYWESDEQWGWATYHYGRWVHTAEYGWVWIPGDEWGPSWVEWRYGSAYVGWAPLPPEAAWRNNTVVYGSVDISAPRYHPSWVFVAEADFARGSIRARRVPSSRNGAMISTTVRAGGYATVNGRIVNRGVDANLVSAAAKVRIAPAIVVQSQSRIDAGPRVAGRVMIYQPRVVARATTSGASQGTGQTRLEAEEAVRVRPSTIPQIGGGVGGSVDVGRGGGIGVGVGGGLRIGR